MTALVVLDAALGGTALHSALAPAGPQAARIAGLWWLLFWIATTVYALVVGFLIVALFRSRSTAEASCRRRTRRSRLRGSAPWCSA
jgi:cytochrome c oxidase subunit II